MSMNPDIKARWVAALRDPEAKQAKGTLNRVQPPTDPEAINPDRLTVGQCCLGVLAEIAVAEGITTSEVDERPDGERTTKYADPYTDREGEKVSDTASGVLPRIVRDWAGLPDTNPSVNHNGRHTLAALNDDGFSFAEIADLIDAQL